MSDKNLDITKGIDTAIIQAIDKSIENNSKETFQTLHHFVSGIISLSINNRSINHFNDYIFFPTFYYTMSYEKVKYNSSLQRLHKLCSEKAAQELQLTVMTLNYQNNNIKDIESKKIINQFYYLAFTSFGRLLYFILMNRDISQFNNTINKFEEISGDVNNYQLKSKIEALEWKNENGANSEEIKQLKEKWDIFEKYDMYKRHTLIGIKYWLINLYHNNKISLEEVLPFLEAVKIPQVESKYLLNDILFFRKPFNLQYMEWVTWTFKEQSDPRLNVIEWLTMGFIVDQIRKNNFYINPDQLSLAEVANVQFLYEDLKKDANILKENFEKWKDILSIETPAQLNTRCDSILSLFEAVKRKEIGDKEHAIADTPISDEQVLKFKQSVGLAWKSQARIHRLFQKFNNTEHVTSQDVKLKKIGQRTFFERAKMAFIDGKHHDMIHGISQMGGETGRWEDNDFFNTIMSGDVNSVSGSTLIDTLDNAIIELKEDSISPNLILMSPEFVYKDEKFFESNRFISRMEEPSDDKDMMFFSIGKFDGIPIYTSYSDFLKNKVVVCDFNKSFKMLYKTNVEWYDQQLKVDVHSVSDEDAERKLNENPSKWKNREDGLLLSDEDALILIKTSVIIDIWTTLKFTISDKVSYRIGHIKSKLPD